MTNFDRDLQREHDLEQVPYTETDARIDEFFGLISDKAREVGNLNVTSFTVSRNPRTGRPVIRGTARFFIG